MRQTATRWAVIGRDGQDGARIAELALSLPLVFAGCYTVSRWRLRMIVRILTTMYSIGWHGHCIYARNPVGMEVGEGSCLITRNDLRYSSWR